MAVKVNLTQHQQELVAAFVAEGVYKDASEAVADGLLRIEHERAEYAAKLEALRSEVQKGFDDVDAGNSIVLETQEDRDAYWADLDRRVSESVAARASKAG